MLQLGNLIFEPDDLPEEIALGGEQMMAVTHYPGGHKEVQSFGAQARNPYWSGVFNYHNALAKVRIVDAMYKSGDVYPLRVGQLPTMYCVIRKFQWLYRSNIEIPYEIELEIAPKKSLLIADPASTSPATSSNDDTPPPQQSYTVRSGDTLWAVAVKYYGDGTQYRKIAAANNIPYPDEIKVGMRLVIPT